MAALFDDGAEGILDNSIAFLTDTIKVAVVENTYTFDSSAATMTAALGANEATNFGTRKTLASKTVAKNTTPSPNQVEFKADATLVYTSVAAGETVGGLIFYKEVTNDSDSIPIAYSDSTTNPSTNGNDVTFNQPTNGWFYASLTGTT